ncbi:NHL repeat-containing protein [Patulibacter sp. SYSU D01012]|uniref:NHL repeat-containing protein n=1 Tax=Patulibacter sp. SYSU D01012 TaxID=2817381 RepID=UPI001B3085AE|nr:NHL repeat-containing protein [Patulibacter sp. SYSU D01012]
MPSRSPRPRTRTLLAALATAALAGAGVAPVAAQAAPAFVPSLVGEPIGAGTFRFPQAVAVDPRTGGVFVGDQYSGVIQAFDADGVFRFAFGGFAARGEAGRLGVVGGVAADRSGHVFVLDSDANRVQVFSADDGRYLSSFGGASVLKVAPTGSRPDKGIVSGGIAAYLAPSGGTITVYVADSGHNRIVRFAVSPTTLEPQSAPRVSTSAQIRLARPQGVAVSPKGDKVYVPDNQNHRVVVLHPTTLDKVGEVGSFGGGQGQFRAPYDVAVDGRNPQQIYVADNLNGRVNVYGAKDLGYVGTFGGNGHDVGRFSIVRAVGANPNDAAGGVYVADTANNRIQRLNADGTVRSAWGIAGRGPGYVTRARGVAFRPDGGVAVADTFDQRVQLIAPDGTYETQFGRISPYHGFATAGNGIGQLLLPEAVAYDGAGNAWVADTYNSRLVQFDPTGFAVRTTAPGEWSRPRGLASAPDGTVVATNSGRGTVVRVAPDGGTTVLRSGLRRPGAVTVGSSGRIVVATPTTLVDVSSGARIPPPPGATAWDHPQGLALAPDGALYVAEARTGTPGGARIVRGVPDPAGGWSWETISGEGSGLGQVVDPAALAISPDGRTLLVADAGNSRIQRFDTGGAEAPRTTRLDVDLAGRTDGSVVSAPAGIDCGTDCTQGFGPTRTVTLTAKPRAGARFVGWAGACAAAGAAPTCAVPMGTDQRVAAFFAPVPPPPVKLQPVGVSTTRWYLERRKRGRTPARAATQPRLTVRLNQPAKVVVSVLQRRDGRKVGSGADARCVKVPANARVSKRQRCVRWAYLPVRRTLRLLEGRTVATFVPKFGRRKLGPGAYRLQLKATDAAGNTSSQTTRIVRILK